MLAADKLQLQSSFKQQATALKEKEFLLHHSNFVTVGTQAAVLAGLNVILLIVFQPPPEPRHDASSEIVIFLARAIKVVYYAVSVGAFCANLSVVSQTTAITVLGAGLALRGKDYQSIVTATEGLYLERQIVFRAFGIGLALTMMSVSLSVWLILQHCCCWVAAFFCWLIVTLGASRTIWFNYQRVARMLSYNHDDMTHVAVDWTNMLV